MQLSKEEEQDLPLQLTCCAAQAGKGQVSTANWHASEQQCIPLDLSLANTGALPEAEAEQEGTDPEHPRITDSQNVRG